MLNLYDAAPRLNNRIQFNNYTFQLDSAQQIKTSTNTFQTSPVCCDEINKPINYYRELSSKVEKMKQRGHKTGR